MKGWSRKYHQQEFLLHGGTMSTSEKLVSGRGIANLSLYSMPISCFIILFVVTGIATYTGSMPGGMVGSLIFLISLGSILGWIGDRTPIIRSFFGGGAIVAIFVPAIMVYFNLIPGETLNAVSEFMVGGGFLNFVIAGLITGSILGINSKVLVYAGVRYIIPLLAAVLGSALIAIIVAAIVGFDLREAVMVIALPIMGGGMGAGAVPMSQMYASALGNDPAYYISILVPALALGNVFALIIGSLLNMLGKRFPSLSGNGKILKNFEYEPEEKAPLDVGKMGAGLVISCAFLALGYILHIFIPIHPYALMILSVAIIKVTNIVPQAVVDGARQWYEFCIQNFVIIILTGIGIVYTDIGAVLGTLSISYVLIILGVVVGAALGAGIAGKLVGFYPIEAAITAGLCMANMGGTGDVAVLSAANRMELMPFAQISSRLGGALILLIAGFLLF
ncbi:2-hydroxycarboxylate transporter family protein [Salinicola halimionae]|uniref:2-hydroxycarboxylate transporter family protein n=1 Tax=Salinicola halimionae TaxID=1949081 RepID=UPI000DA18BEA|nr:2-hydroxycarboxylate transporter family protein [Salinicola halimionae]